MTTRVGLTSAAIPRFRPGAKHLSTGEHACPFCALDQKVSGVFAYSVGGFSRCWRCGHTSSPYTSVMRR